MTKEAKNHYLLLKENNELQDIFQKATGDWEVDKERFLRLYEENIKFVLDYENGNIDLDDDEFIDDF